MYDLITKFEEIAYFNTNKKITLAFITLINITSLYHWEMLFKKKIDKNTNLLDDSYIKNEFPIAKPLTIGHLLMGISITLLGFFVLYFMPDLTKQNTFKISTIYFIILIGLFIITVTSQQNDRVFTTKKQPNANYKLTYSNWLLANYW